MVTIVISDAVCVSDEMRDWLAMQRLIRYCEGATYCALKAGKAEMHYSHDWDTTLERVLSKIASQQVTLHLKCGRA